MLLPKKVGPFTLMRRLDGDGMTESYVGILDDPAGKQVVARRVLPVVARDPGRLAQLRARVGDLRAARHPALVPVIDLVEADGDLYILEDWPDGAEFRRVIDHCVAHRVAIPHNVYLNLATQVCNALEALHARPGTESGSENVLHLALQPSAMWVTADGRVTVGRFGLARSPTAIATHATGAIFARVEYLAPEQTHQDQKLTPASDIFALGALLYELLTLKPMFKADSHLQTIHRIRRAEVTTQLLEVKEILPGLDKVLFRALSLNPRHRYQRAFVLREDLRGLMAGYSFSDIDEVTRAFLGPIVRADATNPGDTEDSGGFGPTADAPGESTAFLLGQSGPLSPSSEFDPDTDALLDSQSFPPFDPESEIDTAGNPLDTEEEGAEPPDTDLQPIRTGWVPGGRSADAEAAPTRAPLVNVDTRETAGGRRPLVPVDTGRPVTETEEEPEVSESTGFDPSTRSLLEPTTGPFAARGDTLPLANDPSTEPSPEDDGPREETAPGALGGDTLPIAEAPEGAWPRSTIVPPDDVRRFTPAPAAGLGAYDTEPDGEDEPWPAPAPAAAPRLDPPESLRPPADTPRPQPAAREAPPPARSPRPAPTARAPAAAADEAPSGGSRLPLLVGGVVVMGLAALLCLGLGGGGVLGILATRGAADPVAADARPEPTPAPARPAPTPPSPGTKAASSAAPPAPAPSEPPTRTPPAPAKPAPPSPSPRERQVAVASPPPRPAPPREPEPEPVRPPPVRSAPPPPLPEPEPPAPPPPSETWDAVAAVEELDPAAEAPIAVTGAELDAWSGDAFGGQLGPDAQARLLAVAPSDPGFTRARTLLFLDAKARGDARSRDEHLRAMMALPENRYNPVLLVEQAQIAVEHRDWESALRHAAVAEQHWARLPSDLVYSRKAMIYEIEAVAHTALFYASDGEDLDRLALAIRGWERYRRHVQTRDRPDLVGRADQSLDRLYEIQRRVQ